MAGQGSYTCCGAIASHTREGLIQHSMGGCTKTPHQVWRGTRAFAGSMFCCWFATPHNSDLDHYEWNVDWTHLLTCGGLFQHRDVADLMECFSICGAEHITNHPGAVLGLVALVFVLPASWVMG